MAYWEKAVGGFAGAYSTPCRGSKNELIFLQFLFPVAQEILGISGDMGVVISRHHKPGLYRITPFLFLEICLSQESLNGEKGEDACLEEIPACHGRVNLAQQSPGTAHTHTPLPLHILIFAPQAIMLL